MALLEVKVKMPTSAARTEQTFRQRGFTLVELLVVLAILGLLTALAPPAYDRLRESTQYRKTLRQLIVDLKLARSQAQARGQWVSFEMALDHNRYRWHPSQAWASIPAPLSMRVTTGGDYITLDQNASILFSPVGGSTGGSIELMRTTGKGALIRIDWLTGEITHRDLPS